ncbi:GlyGly-CTERM sorting domain-containing protein [Motilimonas eburnea]|uniref:GlyGly-CTERM sorting domain-containing protein n=1 Tax=Motilimonas eburnea TaxID=1737488 RepID=UPI001E476E55|nr:GlyGly-CTERM sorting domain-containing protein [Motilimonas eburnea]MCE2573864.1 GlyGly-CTERM sorting domain-containing protein [Motilimonas eburnea]
MKIKLLPLCISSVLAATSLSTSAAELTKATMTLDEFYALQINNNDSKASGAATDAGLIGTGWHLSSGKLTKPVLTPDTLLLDSTGFRNSGKHNGELNHQINAMSAQGGFLTVAGVHAIFGVTYDVAGDKTNFDKIIRTEIEGDIAYKAFLLPNNLVLSLEINSPDYKDGNLDILDWPLQVDEIKAANPNKVIFSSKNIDERVNSVCRLYNAATGQSKTIKGHSCAPIIKPLTTEIITIGTELDNPLVSSQMDIGGDVVTPNALTVDIHSVTMGTTDKISGKLLSEIIPEMDKLNPINQHATLKSDNAGGVYLVASGFSDVDEKNLVTFVYKTTDGISWDDVTPTFYDSIVKTMKDANWLSDELYNPLSSRKELPYSSGQNTYDFIVNPDNGNAIVFNAIGNKDMFYLVNKDVKPYLEMQNSNHSAAETDMLMRNPKVFSVDGGATWQYETDFYGVLATESGYVNVQDGYFLPYSDNLRATSGFAFAPYGSTPTKWYNFEGIGSFELMAYDSVNNIIFTGARPYKLDSGESGNAIHAIPRTMLEEYFTWPLAETIEPTPEATPEPTVAPSSEPKETDDEVKKSGGGGGSLGFISLLALGLLGLSRRK